MTDPRLLPDRPQAHLDPSGEPRPVDVAPRTPRRRSSLFQARVSPMYTPMYTPRSREDPCALFFLLPRGTPWGARQTRARATVYTRREAGRARCVPRLYYRAEIALYGFRKP